MATRRNIVCTNAGYHLANYSVVFVQGHAQYRFPVPDPIRDNPGIEYLTYDFHMSDPPQGLACNTISNMFIPSGDGGPTRRLFLSDFCLGYNLNDLQYVLEVTAGSVDWVESPCWDLDLVRDDDDLLVHFAAGSPGQPVHESDVSGGFFTQGFCRAMEIPRTLPDLLTTVRNDVGNSLSSNNRDPTLQIPQIYSSRRLDVDDPNIMKMFGFFNKPASLLQNH
ncbi:hypothetical protein BDV93DRAFT_265938 [Ceratobasidium sp. AG-I]|nr:hypothetical protein BDV93DRAFT_265938 [Ceratobasidium sp. AG-I]